MVYRWEDLDQDMRKAFSLSPEEAVRRFSGRAVRYIRRVRNRRKARPLTDLECLAALVEPARSLEELGERRLRRTPLVPACRRARDIAETLRAEAPSRLEPLLECARRLASGLYDLLGSGPVKLGRIPDWHLDFKAGKRWDPGAYSHEIPYRADRGHDIKVPWELSRLQHLPTLGMATALSGEVEYQDLALTQIRSFWEGNPAYRGVNWKCTMDVALRAGELLVSEGYLREGGDARFWGEWVRTLLVHGRFIRNNLEDGPVRGNHFISDLAGLYLCSLGLPEMRESAEWREFAKEALLLEIRRQVGPDGFDTEASTSYHAFVTEMFFFPLLLGAEQDDTFPAEYRERLEPMLEGVATLMRPDGSLPQIGDNDDGRFLVFSQYYRSRRDWRPLLALGAYFFRRSDWLAQAGDAWMDGAWVWGEPYLEWKRKVETTPVSPAFRSRAFPAAGVYQLAHESMQMVVDAGPVGQGGNGGHAHNDTLAFDLFAFGEEILPDRGTGTYTPRLALRDEFRSTRSHNTVWIPGREINPFPKEPFRLIRADDPRPLRWRVGSRYTYLSAEHFGYRRLENPVTQRRRFLFDRIRGVYLVEDHFLGEGNTRLEANFHLSPGWTASLSENGWSASNQEKTVGLVFRWVLAPASIRERVEATRHSPSYGVTREAKVVRLDIETELPCRLRYSLRPHEGERD